MEIVYCGGCGRVLKEDDFSRGLAQFLDNRPWCAECRPPGKKPLAGLIPAQGGRKSGSSAKHPRITLGMLQQAPDPSKRNLMIGLGALVAAAIVAALVLTSGSGSPPSAPPPPPPRRGPDPPPVAPSNDAERLLRDLEAFASLAAPDKILARCDEMRAKFRGSPQEKRFQAIEASAQEQKKTREQETQLARELEAIQKLIEEDPKFERADEVLKRFKAAKAAGGPRAAELDRRQAAYEKSRRESPHEKHLGPFAADDQGFLRNWLVLGVFSNDKDQGIDTDFLKDEATHDPAAGLAVGKPRWAAYASPDPKIDFYAVPHLGIKKSTDNVVAYAACLVQVPVDAAAEFRMGSDDGGALWVDGRQVGKVHRSRSLKIDEDRYAVPLAPGLHRVLVKVENHSKSFEFVLRIVGPDGNRLPSLRVWN
ncbi:MAG: hypothetical protein HY293_04610 [Planctomycetes bacterium]|nr:hypothetical protein [Planctomycetota bacterium]